MIVFHNVPWFELTSHKHLFCNTCVTTESHKMCVSVLFVIDYFAFAMLYNISANQLYKKVYKLRITLRYKALTSISKTKQLLVRGDPSDKNLSVTI